MRLALDLARSAEGSVSPRPPVGAVVVDPDGRLVGRGATLPAPGPHAETVALAEAGDRARGGTLYVTLEPCGHTGATGPCAEAVVRARVARVVAGMRDPNPLVRGRGFRRLRAAGIEVRSGVMREAIAALTEPFTVWVTSGRPFVTLKLASTLDGKVAAPDGTSQWITGAEARREIHTLRARVDGVLVGAGTVAADDPQLIARDVAVVRQPARVILDSSGRTPPTRRVFDDTAPTIVLTTGDAPVTARTSWERAGARVEVLPRGEGGVLLTAALGTLGRLGMCHVLVEGGPGVAASFVHDRLVDRLLVYMAPKLIGGDAPGFLASGVKTLADAWDLRIERTVRVGADLCVSARPRRVEET